MLCTFCQASGGLLWYNIISRSSQLNFLQRKENNWVSFNGTFRLACLQSIWVAKLILCFLICQIWIVFKVLPQLKKKKNIQLKYLYAILKRIFLNE